MTSLLAKKQSGCAATNITWDAMRRLSICLFLFSVLFILFVDILSDGR